MTKILAGIAALTLAGAATLPLKASAAEQKPAASNVQTTDVSAQRRHYRHRYYARPYGPYWGPRRYWGPRYGYSGYPYPYGAYGAPYGYYRPGFALGLGPFGFRVF